MLFTKHYCIKHFSRPFVILVFFISVSCNCYGQEIIEALPRWLFGMHLNYTKPQPPLSKFTSDAHIGYQFEFQYRLQYNKPFLLGGYYSELPVSLYSHEYIQSTGNGDITIKETAKTRRPEFGLTAGFYPEINWLLQPYLQGRFGWAIFQTSSILKDIDTDEEVDRISEFTTAAPSYGLDIGVHIVPNIWFLRGDVRIGFIGNTSTDFLLLDKEEAGTTGLPIDYFKTYTSTGNWFKISAGLSYLF